MLYLVAIILPPLAILMSGKPFQAILALVLQITLIGWIPAAIWAIFVAHNHYADVRTKRMIKATKEAAETEARAIQAAADTHAQATLAAAQVAAASQPVPPADPPDA